MNKYKTVASSNIISELMLPHILILAEKYMVAIYFQLAFASASKFSGCCVSLRGYSGLPESIEVGELVTMKASVNYEIAL
jgi:hypothetical protein